MDDKNLDEQVTDQPFFARFLENQQDPEVSTDVKAGKGPPLQQTMKYPSDNDEW